jgi:hypothetical protein
LAHTKDLKTMMQDSTIEDHGDGQILHPGSRQLFRHWEMLRAERACPTREQFEFAEVKGILPDMVVIDRDFLRSSFKYRLAGTRVCTLFSQNLTGHNVLTGWDSFESDVISRHLLTVINQQQPAVVRMRLTTDRDQVIAAELVALPVQMRDSHRIQIIGGLFPFRAAQSLGHAGIVKRELVSARVIWTEHQEPLNPKIPDSAIPPSHHALRSFTLIDGGKV